MNIEIAVMTAVWFVSVVCVSLARWNNKEGTRRRPIAGPAIVQFTAAGLNHTEVQFLMPMSWAIPGHSFAAMQFNAR